MGTAKQMRPPDRVHSEPSRTCWSLLVSTLHAGHAVDCVRVQLVVLSLVMAQATHVHAVAAGCAQLAPASFKLTS